MNSDPATRSARNLVRLVILAVALPSLLLTAMGLVAVDNERAAAAKRLEEAYKPVVVAVAQRFNAEMDGLAAATLAPLTELVAAVEGDTELAALRQFVATHPYATNYFVLRDNQAGAWPTVQQPIDPATMATVTDLFDQLGRAGSATHDELFARSNALALSLRDPLRQPLAAADRQRVEELRDRLHTIAEPGALVAAIHLEMALTGAALPAAVARLGLPEALEPTIINPVVDEWRRVVFIRRVGDSWAGFELAPAGFAELLGDAVDELELGDEVEADIFFIQPPRCCADQKQELDEEAMMARVLAWALLKKSNLSWELALLKRGAAPWWSLRDSRATLYLWAVALSALVLVAGLIFTLRTVVREARFARLKTDFVSSVSHDLRTPLTSIRMFTETLLLGRVRNDDERRECLETIAQETERLTRLTARILDFSRMEAGRKAYTFAPTDLGELVRRAVAACRPLIDEGGFTVAVELAPGLPQVSVDADAMTEVVINLLTNAIKYSPDDKRIAVRVRAEAGEVVLEIADHGIGIARVEQQRIFDKFYRVDCRRTTEVGGSGLGLSLVRHIVDAHRGRVVVESSPGAGSTFAVHLPATPPATGSGHGADSRH